MQISNLNLVNGKGATVEVASVELSDKKSASEYFGTWFKQKSTSADVVSWCKERIEHYDRLIKNLSTLMGKAQVEMVQGMDKAQLQAILAQMETPSE
jgi:hypothetical protein